MNALAGETVKASLSRFPACDPSACLAQVKPQDPLGKDAGYLGEAIGRVGFVDQLLVGSHSVPPAENGRPTIRPRDAPIAYVPGATSNCYPPGGGSSEILRVRVAPRVLPDGIPSRLICASIVW